MSYWTTRNVWKNKPVPFRTNFFASFAPIAILIVVIGLFWVIAPMAIGRSLATWEIALVTVFVVAMQWAWRWRQQRQKRQELEGLRDSALW
jgi:uncharacterized protein YjiS (DUF1127 family)